VGEAAIRQSAWQTTHMLLRSTWTAATSNRLLDVPLPWRLTEEHLHCEIARDDKGLRVTIDRKVDPDTLSVEWNSGWSKEMPDGTRVPLPRVRLSEDVEDVRIFVRTSSARSPSSWIQRSV
jgi:hypothetical protein